jgi:hypothetical protein
MVARVRRSFSRCPSCGEPVSQFAAGCAVCGADLEAHRTELAARRTSIPELPGRARLRGSGDVHVTRLVFAIAATLFAPFVGLVLAAWFAYHADQDGRDGIRNALIAVCVGAIAMLYLAPLSIWGLLLN